MTVGNKKNMGATLRRLIAYILKEYKWQCLLVALCILVSTVANIGGTLFMRNLIDDYILPFVNQTQPDLSPLFKALLVMAAVYYIGVFCTWAYNYIMIYVSQGMLKKVRDDLFRHMEHLPIRYFDTKSHGDIMSIYTNDTDTLRQVISQSMPQMLSAAITIVGVFVSMLVLSRPLTLITVVMVVCMVFATRNISSKSGHLVLCQEKVQVKRGLFVESMESYSTVFCDHVFQIIQFGYHLFTEFLNPIHDVFQQITQFCSLPNQCLHVFRLHPALPPFILSIPPLSPASHSNS